MRAYWQQLNERERGLVILGFVCGVLYLIYAFIYMPLTHAYQLKIAQQQEKITTLAWMKQVRSQSLQNQSKALTSHQLLTELTTQLHAPPLNAFPYQLQQTTSGEIQITFAAVPYNPFIVWLWTLHKQYIFTLQQLSVEKSETPGVVKILLVIAVKSQ